MTEPAAGPDPHPRPEPRRPREPLFNAFPLVVGLLTAAIAGVTAIQLLAPPALSNTMMAYGALIGGAGYEGMPRPLGPFAPLILHVFLHGGPLHLFMNLSGMIAFGPAVAMAMGRGLRGAGLFLAFFFVCAIGGGLAQLLDYQLGDGGIAIGASSALSGLLPAVGWIQGGRRGAVSMSVPWLAINLILAVTGAAFPLPIAWAAHLGGLVAGFVAFPVFAAMAAPPRPRRRPEPDDGPGDEGRGGTGPWG